MLSKARITAALLLSFAHACAQPFFACDNECCGSDEKYEVFADYLYWKTSSENFFITQVNHAHDDGIQINNKVNNFFCIDEWTPGVRVGLSMSFCGCADWDISLQGTAYHGKAKRPFDLTRLPDDTSHRVSILNPFLFNFASAIQSGTMHFRDDFRYRALDLDIGKKFCCAWISLRPFIGLKAMYTNEQKHLKANVLAGPVRRVNLTMNHREHRTSKYPALGGRIGLDLATKSWCGLSLFANGAVDFMWGRYQSQINFVTDYSPHLALNNSNFKLTNEKHRYHAWQGRLIAETLTGINWSFELFSCMRLDLSVAWEYTMFFKQSRFLLFQPMNLSTQGLTGSIAVEF